MIFENMDRIVFAGDSVTDMGSANQSEKDYLTMSAEDMSESSKICFAHGTLKRYFALPTPESAETPHGTCLQDGTETL